MPSFSFYVRHLLPRRRGKVGQSIKHITYFYVARGNPQGEPVNMAGFNDANEALSWFNSFKSIIVIITIVFFFKIIWEINKSCFLFRICGIPLQSRCSPFFCYQTPLEIVYAPVTNCLVTVQLKQINANRWAERVTCSIQTRPMILFSLFTNLA